MSAGPRVPAAAEPHDRPRPAPLWEPDASVLRRRAVRDTAGILGLTLASWVLVAVDARYDRGLAFTLAAIGFVHLCRIHVPEFQAGYRRQIRAEIRLRHALLAHVSIGWADQHRVSRAARVRRVMVPVALVGYPPTACLVVLWAVNGPAPWWFVTALAVALAAGYGWGLAVWPRMRREALRWLAAPLPGGHPED